MQLHAQEHSCTDATKRCCDGISGRNILTTHLLYRKARYLQWRQKVPTLTPQLKAITGRCVGEIDNTREQLFRQEFRVVSPLFSVELVPECLAFTLLQPSEWPIRPWLLHNHLWYHILRCQNMTSRERSCLSLSLT